MAAERLTNNGQTTVAERYDAGSATMVVADASKLPSLSSGGQYRIVCYTPESPDNPEVLLVTGRAGNVLTVTPAYEVISGIQEEFDHPAGDLVASSLTAGALLGLLDALIGDHLAHSDPHPQYVKVGSPAAGGDLYYRHDQLVASDTWVVTHNLGKRPSVTVVDSADGPAFGHVQYNSDNQLTVSFSSPFGGKCYCN